MAEKPKKPHKLKARLPRGLADRGPADIAATRTMLEKIQQVYELYGFEPVETPAIEYTDALGKFLPDQDRPNEGVFSFQDDDEQWLSLRYDLTAPLARYVAENYDSLPKPYRSYRAGYVYRNEKPGPGRFRQFMQFDADTVGSASPAADAEMCMMAADAMEALGFERGQYVVKVNNRKVLDGVLEAIGVRDEKQKLAVLRAIDKLDRLGLVGVVQLLGGGRTDESGDFTKGAGLDVTQTNAIKQLLGIQQISYTSLENLDLAVETMKVLLQDTPNAIPDEEIRDGLIKLREQGRETLFEGMFVLYEKNALAVTVNKKFREGLGELRSIVELVQAAGYTSKRIQADFTVVRGLEYYTGPVFEVELLIETNDDKGRPVRFGSVGGGGRYDGLVSRFRGEPVPATGFSIGVSRLQAARDLIQKDSRPASFGPVVVTVFDRERLADYQRMVATLRAANIRAELYLGNPKNMGNQLKYADKRNSPCVIIQGSDEKARGEVQIKDLIEGAKAAAAIASNQEWRETRPAQFSCSESEIVARVREVLARHGVAWG
ncbi:MAG: histidine--tRNA ligase [Xanthobacteraceae bacterium]|nr:MAG: histidine--tRNA ligase [Xanthobacteraceae bacterium]